MLLLICIAMASTSTQTARALRHAALDVHKWKKTFSCFQRTYHLSIKQKQQGGAANGGMQQRREYGSAQSQTLSKLSEGITRKKITKKQLENQRDS